MKERPILFSGEMVRALLDGRKSQTRRIVKPQPDVDRRRHRWALQLYNGVLQWGRAPWYKTDPHNFVLEQEVKCPYGVPGDRLWVRETWRLASINHNISGAQFWTVQFKDFAVLSHPQPSRELFEPLAKNDQLEVGETGIGFGKWRSPIHMPRWASRLTFEITDIRVQRVQEITEEDAKAEGASFHDGGAIGNSGWRHDFKDVHADARSSFARLWNSIHGDDAWNKNSWIWAISFRHLKG